MAWLMICIRISTTGHEEHGALRGMMSIGAGKRMEVAQLTLGIVSGYYSALPLEPKLNLDLLDIKVL